MKKIGIIAGKGRLPILVVEKANKKEFHIYCAAFKGITNKIFNKISDNIRWFKLGELHSIIEYFKSNNITEIIMAGLIKHHSVFNKNIQDTLIRKIFENLKDKKADSILTGISDEFKKNNINLIPVTEILKDAVAEEGVLTDRPIYPEIHKNIDFGIEIAKELSKFDIGQTIVIKDETIVGIEAMEGTDCCILRSGKLAGSDCIIIKIAKFKQDMRFDLPVIGERTIDMMNKVKAKTLVIESAKTIILDKDKVIHKANRFSISIISVKI